jgi:hypothetical protein
MTAPAALLLIAPGCPHCPGMLENLTRLLKEGVIGRLEAVNIAVHPEQAQALGVRGVPWVRIGPFELDGARTPQELRSWAERAADPRGMQDYLQLLLAEGGLAKAEGLLAQAPEHLPELIERITDPELPLQVRLGIGAVVEGLAGTEVLAATLPLLSGLASHADRRVRADACHFLGLTGRGEARATLQARLADEDAEVREIAEEALARL